MGQKCGHCCSPVATDSPWQAPLPPGVESVGGCGDEHAESSRNGWFGSLPSTGCGRWAKGAEETIGPTACDWSSYGLSAVPVPSGHRIFDINLYEGDQGRQNVSHYLRLCKDHLGLHVTTSCFAVWNKSKKANGFGKVIPALPGGEAEKCRVFFFDDNLEWDGREESSGICNLRNAETGEFVEFAEGKNGFVRDTAARHTVIHHSAQFSTVLVKANILDAMEDPEYFSSIIQRYASPSEKLIIFMDVNSTIVCNDTVQGKELANTLLSTIFEFVDFRPTEAFDFNFESHASARIEKKRTVKQIVKDITRNDRDAYSSFWTPDHCWRLFTELAAAGEVTWSGEKEAFSLDACKLLYEGYLTSIPKVATKDGIAASWFHLHESLRTQHSIVLNSFGIDTRKVVLSTVANERQVLHVTVNHGLWDSRDVQKFSGQFPP